MITKITYTDKEALQNDPEVPDKNKVSDTDMNMIKQVVNNNADELDTAKENIEDLDDRKANESDLKDLMYELFNAEGRLDTAEDDIVTLQGNSGHTIEIALDNTTYILTATLKNSAGEVLNTSTVDFPIEELILDVQYDSTTKELVITLKNGQTRRISLTDIIDGLVNQTDFDALEEKVEKNETDIETLQTENTELKAENERLRNDLNNSTLTIAGSGENVTLENTTEARFKKFIIEGNNEQEKRSGKNLAEISLAEGTFQGISYTKSENGGVRANGTTAEDKGSYRRILTKKFKAGTYTFSVKGFEVENATSRLEVIRGDSSTKQLSKNLSSWTVELNDEEEIHINIVVAKNTTIDETIYLQIEENAEATEYEEYGAMPSIEFPSEIKSVEDNANIVVCNKNMLDIQKNAHLEIHGLTVDTDENRIITINGTSDTNVYLKLYSNKLEISNFNKKKKIKAGTYTLSTKVLTSLVDINVSLYVRTGTTDPTVSEALLKIINSAEKSKTFTLAEDLNGVIYMWIPNGTTFSNAKIQIQLEQDSTATDYIANEQQEFTVPVQQEMFIDDYFDFENEKEIHKWKKYAIQGNESTGPGGKDFATMYANGNIARTISLNDMLITNVRNDVFSNCLLTQSKSLWNGVDIGIESSVNANTVCISVPASNIEEFYGETLTVNNYATAWIQYLAHIGLYFIYQLETPEKLNFTETQKTVAKQIKDTAHSYGEKTHIYSTDEVSPVFDVEACGDINKALINMQALILANGEV